MAIRVEYPVRAESFLFLLSNIFLLGVICVHTHDIRCLHIPPTPDQLNHVWLTDANFSTSNDSNDETNISTSRGLHDSSYLLKRHIDEARNFDDHRSFSQSSKRRESLAPKDDLVPMKIQVYYDTSVSALELRKYNLIVHEIIPTVITFFESVLSIRRDFTIDTFRISRRCPNNTLYYARDVVGVPRPYCMDRCEEYAICGEMHVPSSHLADCSYCNSTSKRCFTNHTSEGKGVAGTQLLLYVSAKQTARCRRDQTIAYAAHCAQDSKMDRPVAGHANLCPNSISTDPKDLKSLIATVKHELTHVLGFSVSLFAYFRDQYGKPLTERDSSPGLIPVDPKTGYAKWSDRVIKKIVRSDWVNGEGVVDKEVHIIVTPTVVREVRNHFNCSTLKGAELEDQGSDGTSMTHWEKRLFENEAMTGTHTQNSVYSRLTLAVLQDTGWYVANFSKAEKLDWGQNLGCEFAKQSCKSWINKRRSLGQSIRPFCDRVKGDLLQIACTEDRSSKAVCNMKYFKDPLPAAYRNFDHLDGVSNASLAHYGGSVDLADFCPFIQEFTWQAQNVTTRGSRCDHMTNHLESERNPSLEHHGPQTKCFEHGRRWEQRSCMFKRHWHHYGAGCYKYSCSNGHISVTVGNHTYGCYYPNQKIHIEQLLDQWLYNGTLLCPACEKICPAKSCKIYDKRVIDHVMSDEFQQDMSPRDKTNLEDENLIDTPPYSTLFSPKSIMSRLNRIWNGSSTQFNFNDHLEIIEAISLNYKPPKQLLVCSSATSTNSRLIITSLIATALITSVLMSIRINFHELQ